ncbi:MAG TPA: DUF4190 domain-containing protein [Thermoanaerobaculia bacterium]|nr:DUF4190 domain-containing protein [Thermoanaerobaculia bacterium]
MTLPPPPPSMPPPATAAPASSQAITALVLGVLGVLCTYGILSPFAWYLGNQELKAVREGRSPATGEGYATAAKILGIIGTIYLGLVILWIVVFGGLAVVSGMMSGMSH